MCGEIALLSICRDSYEGREVRSRFLEWWICRTWRGWEGDRECDGKWSGNVGREGGELFAQCLCSPIWCRVQYPIGGILRPERLSHINMSIYKSNQDLAATSLAWIS